VKITTGTVRRDGDGRAGDLVPGNPVPIQAIAKRESIPEPYLQQLFLRLRKQNIVKSVRDPAAGSSLRGPLGNHRGEIIRTAEGKPRGSVAGNRADRAG